METRLHFGTCANLLSPHKRIITFWWLKSLLRACCFLWCPFPEWPLIIFQNTRLWCLLLQFITKPFFCEPNYSNTKLNFLLAQRNNYTYSFFILHYYHHTLLQLFTRFFPPFQRGSKKLGELTDSKSPFQILKSNNKELSYAVTRLCFTS